MLLHHLNYKEFHVRLRFHALKELRVFTLLQVLVWPVVLENTWKKMDNHQLLIAKTALSAGILNKRGLIICYRIVWNVQLVSSLT